MVNYSGLLFWPFCSRIMFNVLRVRPQAPIDLFMFQPRIRCTRPQHKCGLVKWKRDKFLCLTKRTEHAPLSYINRPTECRQYFIISNLKLIAFAARKPIIRTKSNWSMLFFRIYCFNNLMEGFLCGDMEPKQNLTLNF